MKYPLNPQISVIMPVYNADLYLEEAIESILRQSYGNFELIIVCSNPTAYTTELLNYYGNLDNRVNIYYQKREGIIAARNFGCQRASGKFIAVMDADDISVPERLEIQIEYLEKNHEIGLVGSWVDIIDENGKKIETERLPTGPALIGWHLLLGNCIMHSSVLIRSSLLREVGYYSGGGIGYPEDYELWTKVFFNSKIDNIPKPLVKYRIHVNNTSFNPEWMQRLRRYRNIVRNNMAQKIVPEQYQEYIDKTKIRAENWVFTFDYRINDYQIELFEILYRAFKEKFFPSSRDIAVIEMYIWAYLLVYSLSMLYHSKLKSAKIFIKSLCYLNIVGILSLVHKYNELSTIFKISSNKPYN